MAHTSQGRSNLGILVPGYGSRWLSWLYPEYLMDVKQEPMLAASSLGLATGLIVTVVAAWILRRGRFVKVRVLPSFTMCSRVSICYHVC